MMGVIINGIDTAEDMELYLVDDLNVPEAEIKTAYVDIPGASGSLDYTEALTGYPLYENRKVTFTLFCRQDMRVLGIKRDYLLKHFHGRICTVATPDRPGFYWKGRLSVGSLDSYNGGQIPISITAYPYRYKVDETVYRFNIGAGETVDIVLPSEGMPTMPKFLASGAVTLTDADGNTYAVQSGSEVEFPALMLTELKTNLSASADTACTLTITYQEGCL